MLFERWAVQLVSVHVRDMAIIGSVTMVVFDDAIEENFEGGVGVLRTSRDTDFRVNVLTSREDTLLE